MFPSSNHPFTYTHESSFGNDENPSFSLPDDQEHDTPSPFLPFLGNDDELLDNHLFSQHQLLATTTPQTSDHAQINALEKPCLELVAKKTSTNGGKKQTKARKRTPGKKDRHSKIYTAQGPRDRRMRLSLQIARKFFDLQDMLGFDKASKTIEWLFTKSKAAIKEMMGSLPHVKRSCSVFDIIKETSNTNEDDKEDRGTHKNERKCRNVSTFHPLSKDCRDKARARARERTREKMIRSLEKSKQCDDANPNYLEHFEVGEKSKPSGQDMNSPLKAATEVEEPAVTHLLEHQMATVGIIDKFLGMGGSSTLASPSIQNYSYNVAATESSDGIYSNDDFLGFQGNWSMGNARIDRSDFCAILTDHIDPNSTGDVHQQQNPSSSFIIDSNSRSQSHFLGY